jgi:8-oxo-dGTP pyrophosphatase MutT (NUDIX family)
VNAVLCTYLGARIPGVRDSVRWIGHEQPLQIACYRAETPPPLAFVTSVRCVLLRDGSVLVQQDRTTTHILPGGRREGDEPPETTLRRELREETGWEIAAPRLLGFMHFHDPNPAPPGHPYPHPDFLQLVYTASAETFIPGARLDDDYELASDFRPIADALRLPLSARERFFLAAALERG